MVKLVEVPVLLNTWSFRVYIKCIALVLGYLGYTGLSGMHKSFYICYNGCLMRLLCWIYQTWYALGILCHYWCQLLWPCSSIPKVKCGRRHHHYKPKNAERKWQNRSKVTALQNITNIIEARDATIISAQGTSEPRVLAGRDNSTPCTVDSHPPAESTL